LRVGLVTISTRIPVMLSRRKSSYLAIVLSALVGCNGPYNSGDRVLVEKPAYDAGIGQPRRYEVVVFKFPPRPVENGIPKNYIKRLLGLPGELLAIFFGQIFTYLPDPEETAAIRMHRVSSPDGFEKERRDDEVNPNDLWKTTYMHIDSPKSLKLFDTPGKFSIVRKPPDVMMAMRRIVNDNDFQPSDFGTMFDLGNGSTRFISKRWVPSNTSHWVPDDAKGFVNTGAKKDAVDWLTYQHIQRPSRDLELNKADLANKPELVTDFMDYNFSIKEFGQDQIPELNWVGDLMLECQLNVAKPEGEFRIELSRGIFRYQARFDLATGECALFKMLKDGQEVALGKTATTRVKGPGEYNVRLANFDARLTLWVDDDLPFGAGHEYPPPEILAKGEEKVDEAALAERRAPYDKNDLNRPASFGSRGADVKIHHLRLWRDTYYSRSPGKHDFTDNRKSEEEFWRSPDDWAALRTTRPLVMYVQPGHFLCLGDNSPMSSDSRAGDYEWGLVPERLMLGRALMVYFPLNRAGPIR
jgi:Signal peptidase, peptidase S26